MKDGTDEFSLWLMCYFIAMAIALIGVFVVGSIAALFEFGWAAFFRPPLALVAGGLLATALVRMGLWVWKSMRVR